MSMVDEPEPPPYARVPQEQRRSPQAAPFCCPWTSSSTARLLAPAPSSAHGGEMTDQLQAGAGPSGRLYDPRRDERDACGIGFVADVNGRASRTILDAGLAGLERLRHRGAVAADARTGDGAGVLLPIPDGIFAAPGERVGVAMAFLPRGLEDAKEARRVVEQALVAERLELLHWRPGPPASPSTSPPARPGRSPTRPCARPTSWPPSTPTWPTPGSRSPSPCSTSVTRPTRRRHGSAPSRSGSCAT